MPVSVSSLERVRTLLSKSAKAAYSLLDELNGTLVCDSAGNFNLAVRENNLKVALCSKHVRRRFRAVHEKLSKEKRNGASLAIVSKALKRYNELYVIEREVKELEPAERLTIRQEEALQMALKLSSPALGSPLSGTAAVCICLKRGYTGQKFTAATSRTAMPHHDDPQATLRDQLRETGYIADPALVSSLHLMSVLEKPLLIEGEAGVGKTEVAKSLAALHKAPLLRLQCYEGLDAHHALYDWDYKRQLLAIQLAGKQTSDSNTDELKNAVYSDEYLLQRPLLAAIRSPEPVVLLIDEVDRADEEFEALLLEVLSDFQISVPELGTYTAIHRPLVILTSNGVREISDALRRRCLYHYVDYPSAAAELNIVKTRLPELSQTLAHQVVNYVQKLRQAQLRKTPGVAETLDWAAAMIGLGIKDLTDNSEAIDNTFTCLLKTREDREYVLGSRQTANNNTDSNSNFSNDISSDAK